MPVTQTLEIPADRRLTIDASREAQAGSAVLPFSPQAGADGERSVCDKLRDPKTGALPYNAKVWAAMEESRAIMRGEIPAKWYKSIDQAREDLGL